MDHLGFDYNALMREEEPDLTMSQDPELALYVLSGGSGALGQQLIRTVMAQFVGAENPVHVYSKIMSLARLDTVLKKAQTEKALIFRTFVNADFRQIVEDRCAASGLETVDLVGPILQKLDALLPQKPVGKPGLYRDLHKSYFERIDAINYTLNHDDGKNSSGWKGAEIILVGGFPSR